MNYGSILKRSLDELQLRDDIEENLLINQAPGMVGGAGLIGLGTGALSGLGARSRGGSVLGSIGKGFGRGSLVGLGALTGGALLNMLGNSVISKELARDAISNPQDPYGRTILSVDNMTKKEPLSGAILGGLGGLGLGGAVGSLYGKGLQGALLAGGVGGLSGLLSGIRSRRHGGSARRMKDSVTDALANQGV